MNIQTADKTARIRELNDLARTTFLGCAVMLTPGVQELSEHVRSRLLTRVREFNEFNDGNDPHFEHDFGSVRLDGQSYFWKFDYYDKSMEFGSDDPSDPKRTQRTLTIMLASEY